MKKLIALILAGGMLFLFASCGVYSDDETAEILDELLTREADLNGYIYGDSFETQEDPGEDVNSPYQKYYTVHPDSKYVTLSALMNEVDALIASASREEIYAYAFDGVSDGESVSSPPRFAEDKDGRLQINVADNMYAQMRTVYLLGSARALRSTKTHIKAEITVYRFDREGNPVEATKTVEIRQEDGVWKLLTQSMVIGVIEEKP